MIKYIKFLILFFLTSISLTENAKSFNPNLASMLQDTLNYYVTAISNIKGMSASVYYPGQGIWTGTSGVSYTGKTITSDMEFGIASNSKLFVSAAILKLVESNILNLDDSLHEWLPAYNNIDSNITIRQLLQHTSGVSDPIFISPYMDTIMKNPSRVFSTNEVLSWVGSAQFSPGTSFYYSNINYVLAGMVIESATGYHISRIIRDSLLRPLNLDSTFYDVEEQVLGTISHRWYNNVDFNDTSRVGLNSAAGAAGSIFSTSSEMVQWYHALFSGQVLDSASLYELTHFIDIQSAYKYGLGLQEQAFFGHNTWGHGGRTWGYKSRMVYDPATGAVVCGLTNSDPSGVDGVTLLLYKIIVDHLPAVAGSVNGIQTVCQGQNTVTYSVQAIANASSYIWTLPEGATGTSSTNSIIVNYNNSAVSGIVTVRGTNTFGDGVPSSLAVTVNQLPANAGLISGSDTVCKGQNSVTYSVQAIANAASYNWTLPNGSTGSSTSNNISIDFGLSAVSGTITVKGINNCGFGESSSLSIIVNSLPENAGIITGTTTVCQGQDSVLYTIQPISNATTYIWSFPNGATGTSNINNIYVNFNKTAVSGNITVKGTNQCGDGTTSSLAVEVNLLPQAAGAIDGETTVCQGQNSLTYSVPPISSATSYNWELPDGVTGKSTTNSIIVNYDKSAISGNITVQGINECGDGELSSLAVNVNKIPALAGEIIGDTVVCQGSNSINYSVQPIANATSYNWTLPDGVTGTSSINNIVVDYNKSAVSGNIMVFGVNDCGDGEFASLPITVNLLPDTPIITLNENILHSNTSFGNQWYNRNGLIEGATNPDYTVVTNGNYFDIVTLSECSSDTSNVINVFINDIEENGNKDIFKIHPNPAWDYIEIKLSESSELSESYKIEIYNILGECVKDFTPTLPKGEGERVKIDVSEFPAGMYFVRINNQSKSFIKY